MTVLAAPTSRLPIARSEFLRSFHRLALPAKRQDNGGASSDFSREIGVLTTLVVLATSLGFSHAPSQDWYFSRGDELG